MLRDFAIALSLANLHFFAVWADLLPGAPAHYFMQRPPARVAYVAACSNVLLVAAIFFCGVRLVRRVNHPITTAIAQAAFLFLIVMAVNSLRLKIPFAVPGSMAGVVGSAGLFVKATIAVIALMALLWRRRDAARIAAALVLIMAPFTLVTLGRAYWTWYRYDTAFADFASREPAALLKGDAPTNRVLWLIFDELDERLAFESRPAGVDLPEFDRFSNESIFATNAYPPAGDTLRSMPALLSGKSVVEAHPLRANDLVMRFAGSPRTVLWSEEESVFSRARTAGVNSGLVGSYHPYCRVIGAALTTCAWQQWRREMWLAAPETMLNQNLQVLEMMPGGKRLGLTRGLHALAWRVYGPMRRSLGIQAYQASLAEVKQIVNRQEIGLIVVHLPVPHAPYIYRRATGEFAPSGPSSYLDNLALADRGLGEIRRAMEDAATWDATSILVTSDHGYRTELWRDKIPLDGEEARTVAGAFDARVPFMLKTAGQKTAARYTQRFNTIVAHDLVLALLRAEITDTASALKWLDTNRQTQAAPATGRS